MSRLGQTAKNILKVCFGTLGSRVLGLLRDILTAAYLGVSLVSSAFIFGFTIPNLFRRLMGEGALSAAFLPLFTHTLRDEGKEEAFSFLNKILSRAALLLIFSVLIAIALALCFRHFYAYNLKYSLGAFFTAMMMPYTFFICLAALFCSALNSLGAFAVSSLTAVWLNIAIIASTLLGGYLFGANIENIALCMAGGVILGGIFQFTIPFFELRRKGWRFNFDMGKSEKVSELIRLFMPALLGAGVIQLNIFISNLLALYVSDGAVASIYLSNRLVELPLGLFTFAIASVYFPKLSAYSKPEDSALFAKEFSNGLKLLMCISLPAMFGLLALNSDILQALFERGNFGKADVFSCAPILMISAIGIPFYSLATYSVRGFYSLKDTKTPVKISMAAVAINIICALCLMQFWGARGLVAANVISAIFQAFSLGVLFRKHRIVGGILSPALKALIAGFVMAAAIYFLRPLMGELVEGKLKPYFICATLIPLGGIIYLLLLCILKFEGIGELKKIIGKKI